MVRRAVHLLVVLVCIVGSAWVCVNRFHVPGWEYLIVAFAAVGYGAAIVRWKPFGCLVPALMFIGAFVVFGVLVAQADVFGAVQFAWLPMVLAGGLLARMAIVVEVGHRAPSAGTAFRAPGREWMQEVGPIMLVLLGFCLAALGAIVHSEGNSSLAYDDALREGGKVVSARVVAVTERHFSGYKGGGHTEYIPVTHQVVDGRVYRTELDEYAVSNDPHQYVVGQHLQVMYDPADPTHAGVRSAELRRMFESDVDVGRGMAFNSVVLGAAGIPFLAAQIVEHQVHRARTRETRRWRHIRRRVRARRRATRLPRHR